jgi:c(7)-type cytochrome triheme protein
MSVRRSRASTTTAWLRRLALGAAVGISLAGMFLGAHSAGGGGAGPWLDPFAPAKPLVHEPRRPPYSKPRTAPIVELKEEVPRTDWNALRDQLPKDANGATDWVASLSQGLISPVDSIGADAEGAPVLELDVELVPKEVPDFKATFPHKAHTQVLACSNCHPEIFQMERGADPISMEKIFGGEYCGRCHGKVAFDLITGCPRCHLSMPR